MHILTTALVLASDEAAGETSQISPYVFGAFAFVTLAVLLGVVMMIKVGD